MSLLRGLIIYKKIKKGYGEIHRIYTFFNHRFIIIKRFDLIKRKNQERLCGMHRIYTPLNHRF